LGKTDVILIFKYNLNNFACRFHHKKGCVKDSEYPKENKYDFDIERLPSLCLPDQSHNYESDTVYFIIPNSNDDKRVFGKKLKFLLWNV